MAFDSARIQEIACFDDVEQRTGRTIQHDDITPEFWNRVNGSIQVLQKSSQSWSFCPRCLQLMASHPKFNLSLDPFKTSYGIAIESSVKYSELRNSANVGCAFCTGLVNKILEPSGIIGQEKMVMEPDRDAILPFLMRVEKTEPWRCIVTCREIMAFDMYPSGKCYSSTTLANLNLIHSSDLTSMRCMKGREPNLDVAGEEMMEWARSCLKKCESTCNACAKVDSAVFQKPGHLVDLEPQLEQDLYSRSVLSSPIDLKLVSGTNIDRYACLSYTWGPGEQKLATVRANVESRASDGFSSSNVPATLSDAILVARKLGFKHVWIDMLCIVQDGEEEWLVEVMKMKDIFEGAAITIVAAVAASSETGFLEPRSQKMAKFVAPLWLPSGEFSKAILVQNDGVKEFAISGDLIDPSHSRAWTFEEWILSRRRLIFTNAQTAWECQTFKELDGGHGTIPGIAQPMEDFGRSMAAWIEGKIISLDYVSIPADKAWRGIWNDILSEYTTRTLTFPSDKLVALDGLTEKIGMLWNYTYHYGIWKERAIESLCWCYDENTERTLVARHNPNFPTWSWASVHHKCNLKDWYENYDEEEVSHVISFDDTSIQLEACQLVPVTVEFDTERRLARLDRSADIWSIGKCAFAANVRFKAEPDEIFIAAIWPDTQESIHKVEYCIFTIFRAAVCETGNRVSADGLLLLPSEDQSHFRRLAYFNIIGQQHEDDIDSLDDIRGEDPLLRLLSNTQLVDIKIS